MTKYFFIENGKINGCGCVQRLGNEVQSIEVEDEIFDNYIEEPERYVYQAGKIVENPEYETLKQQRDIRCEISSLMLKLDELDKKRIRAICENSIKDEQGGQSWLDYYNEEVRITRNKITELSNLLSI